LAHRKATTQAEPQRGAEGIGKVTRSRTMLDAPPRKPELLPRWLNEHGANVIITGNLARRAHDLFSQQGIRVVLGAPWNRRTT
jgi:predicted Fe-Mo cluster-binding NifX family protein